MICLLSNASPLSLITLNHFQTIRSATAHCTFSSTKHSMWQEASSCSSKIEWDWYRAMIVLSSLLPLSSQQCAVCEGLYKKLELVPYCCPIMYAYKQSQAFYESLHANKIHCGRPFSVLCKPFVSRDVLRTTEKIVNSLVHNATNSQRTAF